jgi:hypothetical protein
MSERTADELRALLDERAIERVLVRYARGIDRCDEALIASVYHEDSHDEHGSFRGTGREFARWVVAVLRESFEATSHCVSNATIELDGDAARVESYVVAYHRTRSQRSAPKLVVVGGRYLDRFERRDGQWRIARRSVVLDWSQLSAIEAEFPDEGFQRGDRAPADPSYRDFFRT